MRAIVAAFVLVIVLAPAAQAYELIWPGTLHSLNECYDEKLYNAGSTDGPAELKGIFAARDAGLAFRVCRDADRNIHYFLREPRPNRNKVCRIVEKEIFPGTEMNFARVYTTYDRDIPDGSFSLRGWSENPPPRWDALGYRAGSQDLGFVSAGACPGGDDPRYVPLANVSDDILKSFQEYWSEVAATPQSLQAAIAALPAKANFIERFNGPDRQQLLRERVITTVFTRKEHPRGYACDARGCSVRYENLEIAFEARPGGIVLTGIAAVWRG